MPDRYTHTHTHIYIYIYIYCSGCIRIYHIVLPYTHTHTHTHIYIYIYVEMIDCGESDSMIEGCGRLNKSNT